jgi:hypothetical protein
MKKPISKLYTRVGNWVAGRGEGARSRICTKDAWIECRAVGSMTRI